MHENNEHAKKIQSYPFTWKKENFDVEVILSDKFYLMKVSKVCELHTVEHM